MIQTKPWEFMVKFTPQRDWIEGHGILIAFALFFGGISGGLYLASLYFDNIIGMFVAWLLAGLTGLIDMAHLTRKMRFWRMILRLKTSWISRGFMVIWLFLGLGAVQLALTQWAPGTGGEMAFKVLAGIAAFGVAIYSGFVVSFVGGIKFWNSAIVPILFVVAGLAGGMAVLLLASLGETSSKLVNVANFTVYALVAYAVFVAIYLWVTTYESSAARESVMRILKGNIALVFWLGVVVLGVLLPIVLVAPFSLGSNSAPAAFAVAGVFIILGGVALRYSILKAGVYSPLVPTE